jgi:regulator of sigma E protease
MNIITNILGFLILIGILITFHEGGHFLAAKLFKFPVEIFSIGFGPKIFSWRRKETEYRISSIPFGGFVKIKGLGIDESLLFSKEEPEDKGTKFQKFLIFFSGPLTNIILCILILTISFMIGIEVPAFFNKPVLVGYVEEGSPAFGAGIKSGDKIIEIDGKKIRNWEEFKTEEALSGEKRTLIKIERDGEIIKKEVVLEKKGKYKVGSLGIYPDLKPQVMKVEDESPAKKAGILPNDLIEEIDGKKIHHAYELINYISEKGGTEVLLKIKRGNSLIEIKAVPKIVEGKGRLGMYLKSMPDETILKKYPFLSALNESLKSTVENTTLAFKVLKNFFSGRGEIAQISGPIDMAKFSGEAMRSGLSYFLNIMGIISLQLAIFNLLPIPALDGGHLFILLIEIIIRRNISIKVKYRILQFGFTLLLSLMVLVLVSDLIKNL